jgi:hypothetical protein
MLDKPASSYHTKKISFMASNSGWVIIWANLIRQRKNKLLMGY